MRINKLFLVLVTIFFGLVVITEVVFLEVTRPKDSAALECKPATQKSPEKIQTESDSYTNWMARYQHIESMETNTLGIFDHFETNVALNETKIVMANTDGKDGYYIAYATDSTQIFIYSSDGKKIQPSALQKGDHILINETYIKKGAKQTFIVTITQKTK